MEIGGDLVQDDLSDPKKDILDRGVEGNVEMICTTDSGL